MKTSINNTLKSSEGEEEDPKYFVYTSETKQDDIPVGTLTHLRIDSSVSSIPAYAFDGREALVHVQVPETLTRIGQGAFEGCSKLMGVQFVCSNASPSLETDVSSTTNPDLEDGLIRFPENAKLQIDDDAFFSCHSLRKVVVCSVSTKVCDTAFANCQGLVSVELPEGLQVIEPAFFLCGSLTTVKIPSSVIKICKNAFTGCHSLTMFDLPYGLVEIGVRSFQQCQSIETLHIPDTVSKIGERAFTLCSGLKFIKLPRSSLERIEESTFSGCRMLEYIMIPSTVSFIGWGAFHGCRSLTHIRIPPSVDCMMDWAFENCCNLMSMELPENLMIGINQADRIGGQSFSCSSLVNFAIPRLTEASLGGYLRNSKIGSVVDSDADLDHKLKHRFDKAPLNKLCYYQSYYSSDDSMLRLHSLMEDDPLAAVAQMDEFGMTPLHVLSLSQTPNLNMLLAVMKGCHLDHVIHCKDSFGSTPMDYLCLNRAPTSTQVIRSVLNSRFSYLLSLNQSWSSELLQAVDEALAVERSSRRRGIVAIYLKLAKYERQEVLAFVELYLWKMKIEEVITNEQTADRQTCRITSGASIVIPYVLPFLDKLGVEDYFNSPDLSVY
eukprot:scaffold1228_cov119-Cylindrotheca_fusiformis.AAC.5